MKYVALASLIATAAVSASILRGGSRDPAGAGIAEPSQQAACSECKAHADHLSDCVCFVTDVMHTFEDDSTRELTTRKGYGFETKQTGKDRRNHVYGQMNVEYQT